MVRPYAYQHNSTDKWSGFYKKTIKGGLDDGQSISENTDGLMTFKDFRKGRMNTAGAIKGKKHGAGIKQERSQ